MVVKKNIIQSAFKFLQSKKITHSKVQHIDYSTLEIAPYLMDANFSHEQKVLLHSLRTSMVRNVAANFRTMFNNDTVCKLCTGNYTQTQSHLLDCETLVKNCAELYNNIIVKYEDIFSGNTSEQLRAVKLFTAVLLIKEKFDDSLEIVIVNSSTKHY